MPEGEDGGLGADRDVGTGGDGEAPAIEKTAGIDDIALSQCHFPSVEESASALRARTFAVRLEPQLQVPLAQSGERQLRQDPVVEERHQAARQHTQGHGASSTLSISRSMTVLDANRLQRTIARSDIAPNFVRMFDAPADGIADAFGDR